MKKEKYFKIIIEFLKLFGNTVSKPDDSLKIYNIDLSHGLCYDKLKNIVNSMYKDFDFEDTYVNNNKAKFTSFTYKKLVYSLLIIENESSSKITLQLAYTKI